MTRIVQLEDHKPLLVKKAEMTEDVWICRCGLSADWPYCDGTHKKTFGEQPGKLYKYRREAPGGEPIREEIPEGLEGANPRPKAP